MIESARVLDSLVDVSRETVDRLTVFHDLLVRWQRKTNLVGSDTLDRFWSHHVGDAAFLYARARDVEDWVDLGAGAGLPGLVVAILAAGDAREMQIDLVESNGKKCAFQREVVLATGLRNTGVRVAIHCVRIEAHTPRAGSVATARALAPLADLISYIKPFGLKRGLFFKGERHDEEMASVRRDHGVDMNILPHPLRPGSVLVDVRL